MSSLVQGYSRRRAVVNRARSFRGGRGWYAEVVTGNVPIANGALSLPELPGLGTAPREQVLTRPDAHVEVSDERHRYYHSKA
jgi:hypothetical protein